MRLVALQAHQMCALRFGFHTFRDGQLVEAVRQGNGRVDRSRVRWPRKHPPHEGEVDLQTVTRQSGREGERGIAGSEVINGDPDPQVAQGGQLLHGG